MNSGCRHPPSYTIAWGLAAFHIRYQLLWRDWCTKWGYKFHRSHLPAKSPLELSPLPFTSPFAFFILAGKARNFCLCSWIFVAGEPRQLGECFRTQLSSPHETRCNTCHFKAKHLWPTELKTSPKCTSALILVRWVSKKGTFSASLKHNLPLGKHDHLKNCSCILSW